jgi:hypothetical protein
VRTGRAIVDVMDAGACGTAFQAKRISAGSVHLEGDFGVFFSGQLQADLLDEQGKKLKSVVVESVSVEAPVKLDRTISAAARASRVSLRLIDASGQDRGELGSAPILAKDKSS